ncbi:hypothetical protein DFH09DRAFT_1328777 [Mycena vulgaris]|nr:hypothetical protein DFH09DRAFT_1328777 [Mycena vulgaris]
MSTDPPWDPVRRPHGGCCPPFLRGNRFPPPPGRAITGFAVLQIDVHASPIIHQARHSVHSCLGSALVLDRALRFWYPNAEPITSETLDEFREVLEAVTRKYDMQLAVPSAENRLRKYLSEDRVAVYGIACRHEWKDLALDQFNAFILRDSPNLFDSRSSPHSS